MKEHETALFRETLARGATELGVPLTEAQQQRCLQYTEMLLAANEVMNLTRITEPAAVAIKHFIDSLTVLRAVPDLMEGAWVADVGTGAGFPGIPLKIVRPDLHLTLIDSVRKRLGFLSDVCHALEFGTVSIVHARAEDAGQAPEYRESFDLVTARAVAALPVLLEWCGPLVNVGGRFVAMKGSQVDEELTAARLAPGKLGLQMTGHFALNLPSLPDDKDPPGRRLLIYTKKTPTPARYPRSSAEIKERPL